MAFFTVLSCHTCSVQSVCAHAGDDLTQKLLVKKQRRLGSHSPQCGSSTPGYLSTVLGNTCRSHTPLSAQCLEFCGGNNYMQMQMQPQWNVQEVMNPHPVVLPARYHLSFGCAAWQKSPDLQVRVWKKSKWCKHCWLLRTASLFFYLYFQQYFPCISSGFIARSRVAQAASCCLKLAWQKDWRSCGMCSCPVQQCAEIKKAVLCAHFLAC